MPLQLNYPVHNGEASRTDTSIERVSAALCRPTISISAEIDLLPRGRRLQGDPFNARFWVENRDESWGFGGFTS